MAGCCNRLSTLRRSALQSLASGCDRKEHSFYQSILTALVEPSPPLAPPLNTHTGQSPGLTCLLLAIYESASGACGSY